VRDLALADLDLDGDLDVVQALEFSIQTRRNDGTGSFGAASTVMSVSRANGIATGDLDGNGYPDLVVGCFYFTAGFDCQNLSVALNEGGEFLAQTDYPVGLYPGTPAVGDFDGDGWADVAFTSAVGTTGVRLMRNTADGSGGLRPRETVLASASGPLHAAHVNGDAHLDLVGGGSTSGVYLLAGNGDGTFDSPLRFGGSGSGLIAPPSDFTGDGRADFATSVEDAVWLWPGSETATPAFTIAPAAPTIDLWGTPTRRKPRFAAQLRNVPQISLTWTASAGTIDPFGEWTPPTSMPAGGSAATVTAANASPSLSATSAVDLADVSWVQAGIVGRRVDGITVSGADPAVVYAAADDGVHRSENGGASFVAFGTGFPLSRAWQVVEAETAAGTVLLAATDNGVFRADAGEASSAWTAVAGLAAGRHVLAADGSAVYAARGAQLFKSTDGGSTWSAPTGRSTSVIHAVWAVDATHVYVSDGNGLAYTADGGVTWSERGAAIPLASNHVSALAVDPADPQHVLAGVFDDTVGGALWVSDDGGATWRHGELPVSRVHGLAWTSDPDVVYAIGFGFANGDLFKSVDGGETWVDVTRGPSLPGSNRTGTTIAAGPEHALAGSS
jgi:hypothetical protein